MICLGRVKFTLCIIFIIFTAVSSVHGDECVIRAICNCTVENETTKLAFGSDGGLEGHFIAEDKYDICNRKNSTQSPTKVPPTPNTSTTTESPSSTPNAKLSLTTPVSLAGEQKNIRLVLLCESVDLNNKSGILPETKNGTFILSLKYSCNAPPHDNHSYSTGSVLVIIFFTFVFAYLGLGIAVRFFLIGARGVELVPHLSFWRDFPTLVRDGAKFLQNGCTARPSDVATASPEGYDAI